MTYSQTNNKIFASVNEVYHKFATKLNLSDTAYFILDILLDEEGVTQNTLCAYLFTPKQTIHSCVISLRDKNYITMDTHKKIYLTETGKQFAMNTVGKIKQIEEELFASWKPEEREIFLRLNMKYLHDLAIQERSFKNED